MRMQTRRSFLVQTALFGGAVLAVRSMPADSASAEPAIPCPRPYGSGPYGRGCYPGGNVRLSAISRTGDEITQHGYRIHVSSTRPGAVIIEYSDDLEEWHFLERLDGEMEEGFHEEITDLAASSATQRFYRARLEQAEFVQSNSEFPAAIRRS